MKKYLIRVVMVLALSSALFSSCSLEYRQHRREQRGHDHDHDHDDHDHHYNRY